MPQYKSFNAMCAFTFCYLLAIFNCLEVLSSALLVGPRKVQNMRTITLPPSMTSDKLPASFAGYTRGKDARNGKTARK